MKSVSIPAIRKKQRVVKDLNALILSSVNKFHNYFRISIDVKANVSILNWGRTALQSPFKV